MNNERYNAEGYPDPTAYEALLNVAQEENATRSYFPIVYIASPFAGDIEKNVEKARGYCRFAVGKGCISLAPHLHFPQFMDDGDAEQRALGLRYALILLGKCEELWVFGERVSEGMSREIAKAKRRRIPIRYFLENCVEVRKNDGLPG
jgi:hypothetical protein